MIQLYGPFQLNTFNGGILIGLLLVSLLLLTDKRRKLLISSTDLCNVIVESAIVGYRCTALRYYRGLEYL